jgi:D-alanyl-D-alanine carboxypeptidase
MSLEAIVSAKSLIFLTLGLLLLGVTTITGCASQEAGGGPVPTSIAELDAYLDSMANAGGKTPPGLSVVAVRSEGIVYSNAFGFADGPRVVPASSETVYNYWSMTKPFTAVAILQLVEKGIITLDDCVDTILDFFQVEYPDKSSECVTIRHLLTHSSGLSNNAPEVIGWVHTDGGTEWNQTELIRQKLPDYAKLKFEPGSQGVYTNVGYMVLAAVIEAASGMSYEEYVRKSILQPLGMNRTGFLYSAEMAEDQAVGAHPRYDLMAFLLPFIVKDSKSLIREKTQGKIWFKHIYSDQNGPTGLIGSATDLSRFLAAILNHGSLDGSTILSPRSVESMLYDSWVKAGKSPETSDYDDARHGLGWFILQDSNEVYFHHGGGGPGFATGMRVYPESDLAIVVMANGTQLPTDEIITRIKAALTNVYE